MTHPDEVMAALADAAASHGLRAEVHRDVDPSDRTHLRRYLIIKPVDEPIDAISVAVKYCPHDVPVNEWCFGCDYEDWGS